MIAKLVIGPWLGGQFETASPHTEHPHVIAQWVERAHRSGIHWTICTHSPTVIRAVIQRWDKDPETLSRIWLRSENGNDTKLLDLKNPDWLAHFLIEDLYMCGEFDEALKDKP